MDKLKLQNKPTRSRFTKAAQAHNAQQLAINIISNSFDTEEKAHVIVAECENSIQNGNINFSIYNGYSSTGARPLDKGINFALLDLSSSTHYKKKLIINIMDTIHIENLPVVVSCSPVFSPLQGSKSVTILDSGSSNLIATTLKESINVDKSCEAVAENESCDDTPPVNVGFDWTAGLSDYMFREPKRPYQDEIDAYQYLRQMAIDQGMDPPTEPNWSKASRSHPNLQEDGYAVFETKVSYTVNQYYYYMDIQSDGSLKLMQGTLGSATYNETYCECSDVGSVNDSLSRKNIPLDQNDYRNLLSTYSVYTEQDSLGNIRKYNDPTVGVTSSIQTQVHSYVNYSIVGSTVEKRIKGYIKKTIGTDINTLYRSCASKLSGQSRSPLLTYSSAHGLKVIKHSTGISPLMAGPSMAVAKVTIPVTVAGNISVRLADIAIEAGGQLAMNQSNQMAAILECNGGDPLDLCGIMRVNSADRILKMQFIEDMRKSFNDMMKGTTVVRGLYSALSGSVSSGIKTIVSVKDIFN